VADKIIKLDDLDGTEFDPADESAGGTVRFMWEGSMYDIDLADVNRVKFQDMMSRYVASSRRSGNSPAVTPHRGRTGSDGRRRGGGHGMGMSKEELDGIRAWAREHGHRVADSGIIPQAVMEAWQKRDLIPTIPSTQATARGKAPGSVTDTPQEPAVREPAFSGRGSDKR
jgi:hypothetical protein